MKDGVVVKRNSKDMSLPDEVSNSIEEIGGLRRLSSKIPPTKQLNNQLKIHHVLSDKSRLKILWAVKCCELCPCVLKEFLKIPDTKLSYHLSVLEKAGLVKSTTKKNWRIYSITERGKDALGCSHQFSTECKITK
jgi:ArsR family transcriptional regulator